MSYLKEQAVPRAGTSQSKPIPGSTQVPNSAGGFAWEVDEFTRLRRWLILGSEGGSYYASQQDLTAQNAEIVRTCLAADGARTVEMIREISTGGLAPKNDQAIYALAMCTAAKDEAVRTLACATIPDVCRIGTHIFQFAEFVQGFRGWGPALVKGVGRWYSAQEPSKLAYQMVKYRQRDGWTHRDLLRLAHPQASTQLHRGLYDFACGREYVFGDATDHGHTDVDPVADEVAIVEGYVLAQKAKSADEVAPLIRQYNLPREALLTEHLADPKVWEALLAKMPMTAMVRNLGNMTRNGVLTTTSTGTKTVVAALASKDAIRKSMIHPWQILLALDTYRSGAGRRGSGTWTPVSAVVDALDEAFYLAFGNVEQTGQRILLALDCSGSMSQTLMNTDISAAEASAAMAMVTVGVEPLVESVTFSNGGSAWLKPEGQRNQFGSYGGGTHRDGIEPISLSKRRRLDDVVREVRGRSMGGTDCALPMQYALANEKEIDTFIVYTDSETWAGDIHPVEALRKYREKTGINARLIVVGMTSNEFSIADPDDPWMLDVVGFDASAPQIMSEFMAGRI